MNKMLFTALIAIAALTGCATTTAPVAARPTAAPLPPTVTSTVPPTLPPMAVPPARPEAMMGPPQNMAWMHTPPYGCERGPYSLAIYNDTTLHMRVMLDGEELMVRGAYGVLPTLPPGSAVYVCLAHTDLHTITGVAFALRYGVPQEVPGNNGRFEHRQAFGTSVLSSGRHEFHINDMILWHQ